MSHWSWTQVASIVLLSGCAATSTMVGVREPDLTRIKPDDQRAQVEKTLGDRLWRAGSADGLTYDIYQYEEARPARPVLGAIGFGLGVLSFGATEAEIGDVRLLSWPVKQVAVGYDERDRVRFVSQPWKLDGGGPCSRMRSLLPPDSGLPASARPSPSANRAGSASEVATVQSEWLERAYETVDGRNIDAAVIELPPGHHSFVLHHDRFAGLRNRDLSADVELLANRGYRVRVERFTVGYRERTDLFWIEDADSDETLGCAW